MSGDTGDIVESVRRYLQVIPPHNDVYWRALYVLMFQPALKSPLFYTEYQLGGMKPEADDYGRDFFI